MHLSSTTGSELRITLETLMSLTNAIADDQADTRQILANAGFSRAASASAASVARLEDRLRALAPFFHELPTLAPERAAVRVNEELTEVSVKPSLIDHDGVGLHIHWTPATATFDDQVVADALMALAHELADEGTRRFGQSAADDCDHLFYDTTRNRSRRFCADPRSATRTHVAEHRARQRSG